MSTRQTPTGDAIRPTFGTWYDALLLLLPLPLLLGVVGAVLTSAPVAVGAGVGGLPSAALLAYGLFVEPPTPGRSSR
ncbi:hypothetical protein SAMN04488063_2544 [Halopelagius inordinatus]|uniref:Uncharacterized protein n=1 Tax=Halopelagius inordinatus TaxID=553467 RepID=A0A1I2T525_9EURY|nr:hypothetical protein [Halopelagius inordinatus]SFG60073.1 hypothetical protein SAMN04488063_2544 [Halopelagius inordinatus]